MFFSFFFALKDSFLFVGADENSPFEGFPINGLVVEKNYILFFK
ncbi:Uncharacterized protein dnm_016760 [Desulfonema magnum]|uniref:Uncharacterized protein n=1 Tax=Desulfonema magnum TaxID=45655 RepID=A0A975GMB2_9BACT|nr:Uncharacterized protein dnm_016760 [Desulfonema magnum]